MKKRVLLLLSGGMDSVTLLYWLLDQGYEVEAVSFNYNQRHSRELVAGWEICNALGVKRTVIPLSGIGGGSALTHDQPVPHGHYAEESMKATVVPNRNMVMLAHAISLAIEKKMDHVACATHSGDHAIYPDCRPEFIATMDAAAQLCDWHKVTILSPFISISKTHIAQIGRRLKVPYEKTWTCYEGGEEPCGKCGACVERAEAMRDSE